MARLSVDAGLIRELARLLEETGLSEIEIGDGPRHVRVARGGVDAMPSPRPASPPVAARSEPAATARAEPSAGAVTSPMVGTVYLSPEPGAPPYVTPGDAVAEGQTLLVIEAMKVMNPIKAPRAGRVLDVPVANGSPVEYGEVLVVLG
ncbi:MAG: acetyl-CoA carboxylase biotin carboxyl carrier protein subunit [Alphaproteobacteria bacterium]